MQASVSARVWRGVQLADAEGELVGDALPGGGLLDGGVGNPEDGGSDEGTPPTTRTARWKVDEGPTLFVHFTSNTI